jgi:hypothetical protein
MVPVQRTLRCGGIILLINYYNKADFLLFQSIAQDMVGQREINKPLDLILVSYFKKSLGIWVIIRLIVS